MQALDSLMEAMLERAQLLAPPELLQEHPLSTPQELPVPPEPLTLPGPPLRHLDEPTEAEPEPTPEAVDTELLSRLMQQRPPG